MAAWHQTLDGCVLCWMATADGDGQPNASPKEVFAVVDDQHLLIAQTYGVRPVNPI